ncbi:MAG: hypothetical protein ACOVML_10090 [Burkholderiaceae bacterium]
MADTTRSGIARVLIVDDEPDLRELLELTLIKLGLDTDTAGSLTEAKLCLDKR